MANIVQVADLAEAVDGFLNEIRDRLDGREAFHAKVAQNVLGIIAREAQARCELDSERRYYAERADTEGDAEKVFCAMIRDGRIGDDDPELLAEMKRFVVARLSIDNPRFSTLARLHGDEE